MCAVVPAVRTIRSTTSVQLANTCGRLDSSNELHLNKTSNVKVRRKKQTPVALSLVQLVNKVGFLTPTFIDEQILLFNCNFKAQKIVNCTFL